MLHRDLVSRNSLICGFSRGNRLKEVLVLVDVVKAENVKADVVTMVKVIIASSHFGGLDYANTSVVYRGKLVGIG